jgi:Leucine-rich repeat (LRR) protein
MQAENTNINEIDLHWTNEDPDLGIAPEGVRCKDMGEVIQRISAVKDTVKKINLNNQPALTEIPSILKECKLLEEIDISRTRITEIPAFLFTLPNLRSLSCCCRELSSPLTGLAKAEKLQTLNFQINENGVFPDEITALHELKVLDIGLYSNAVLPENFGNLKKLEDFSLSLYYHGETAPGLPASFEKHPALRKLGISDHIYKNHKTFDLAKAAQILASCPAFKSLVLSSLGIGQGHKNLSLLTGLKELELRHLLVEGNIFDSITTLNNLEKLDIWGSELKLTALPDIFGKFKELRTFSFAGNFIKTLPPSVYGLDKLTTLEIGSTGLSALDDKIGTLQNLEKIHVFDNLLETLPEAVFTLPRLAVLDIQENIIRQKDIAAIREKISALGGSGQKIELMDEGQGHRLMLKKLRALENIAAMEPAVYYKHCLDAVNEDPHTIKFADKKKLQGNFYAGLCLAAAKKSCFALEDIDPKMMDRGLYFRVCVEAAKNPDIGHAFRFINVELLSEYEYIQVCLEAALHNIYADFLNWVNAERLSRSDYERICWAAILHHPAAITSMIEPTEELRQLAAKLISEIKAAHHKP